MAIVVHNSAKILALDGMLDLTYSADSQLGLFTSTGTLDCTLYDFGLTECTDATYARQTLAHTTWSPSASSCIETFTYGSPLSFSISTTVTLQGWFIWSTTYSRMTAGAFFTSPIVIGSSGATVTVTPVLSMGDCS